MIPKTLLNYTTGEPIEIDGRMGIIEDFHWDNITPYAETHTLYISINLIKKNHKIIMPFEDLIRKREKEKK